MSLSSLSSLATTAFDTARSTMKAMAQAAAESGTDACADRDARRPAAPGLTAAVRSAEVQIAESLATEPKAGRRRRLGSVLDAYA